MIGHRLGAALESLERVARLEAGVLLILGAAVLAGVQESLARADQAEDGTVMAGRQVDRGGRQVASLANADHGIKLASWIHSLHW